jgi:SAM-dependent methyltransferase
MNDRLRRVVEREKALHTEQDMLERGARLISRFAHITRYPSRRRLDVALARSLGNLVGMTVLDYGCGPGSALLAYLDAGARKVCGIDISENYIARCRGLCEAGGYAPDRYDLRVMDAHNPLYEAETFDFIIGRGILHHLDVSVARQALHRVLKHGGRMLFQEPLADNPLLRIYRWLTPHVRTPDEHPFSARDLRELFPPPLWSCEFTFCGILEAPLAMITSVLIPSRPDNSLTRLADKVEAAIHRRGILPSWNQYVFINVVKA